ncbi:MAG TPA: TetR/AcrR family transcriptional regulator, partial [Bacteroidales bacterium]|nr:TetR/AcrR family transcriptional regulator [Bacteroidales bacterium]
MSPRTQEQFENIRQAKREQILLASLALFANKGYQSTSIDGIAKRAGISKGLMYNYFESKESILLHLLDHFVAETTCLLNPNNDDEITNDEMGRFLEELIQSMIRQQDLWKLYLQLSVQPFVVDMVKIRISQSK